LCIADPSSDDDNGVRMLRLFLGATFKNLGYDEPSVPSFPDGIEYVQLFRKSATRGDVYHVKFESQSWALKHGDSDALDTEDSNINALMANDNFRLLCPLESKRCEEFLLISPVGRHPTSEDDLCAIFRDVVKILSQASKLGYLHGDISSGNVIVAQGKGILIDWHTAHLKGVQAMSGTRMFMAYNLELALSNRKPYTHTDASELESLFYVFLYYARKHGLPWTLLSPRIRVSAKFSVLNKEEILLMYLDRVNPNHRNALVELRKLFARNKATYENFIQVCSQQ
jgi:serine/threonine protein kinase